MKQGLFTMIIALATAAAGAIYGQTAGSAGRGVNFNGRPLTGRELALLESLERYRHFRLPDGNYWYDTRSGAAGQWCSPPVALLPPGLGLGGRMPAGCSRGDTGIFVNGREVHHSEITFLKGAVPMYRGRYWMNANGDFGLEGGLLPGNINAMIRASQPSQQRASRPQRRVYSAGEIFGVITSSAGSCTDSACYYPGTGFISK